MTTTKSTHYREQQIGTPLASLSRIARSDAKAAYLLSFDMKGSHYTLHLDRTGVEALSDMLADFLCDTPTLDETNPDAQLRIDFPEPGDVDMLVDPVLPKVDLAPTVALDANGNRVPTRPRRSNPADEDCPQCGGEGYPSDPCSTCGGGF